jgi:hypothetical protein
MHSHLTIGSELCLNWALAGFVDSGVLGSDQSGAETEHEKQDSFRGDDSHGRTSSKQADLWLHIKLRKGWSWSSMDFVASAVEHAPLSVL